MKEKTYKIIKSLVVLSLTLVFLVIPLRTSATIGLPFGGYVLFPVPCTCSFTLAVFMAPLYPNPPLPPAGFLVYTPASLLYPLFAVGVPTTWELGKYIPGVPACWIGLPPFCAPIPVYGVMTELGTSGPGFIP